MNLTILPWSTENQEDLPEFRLFPFSCNYCAFWESHSFNETITSDVGKKKKLEWFVEVRESFGNCGFIAIIDGAPVGFAQYAPAVYFPALEQFREIQLNECDVLLACLYIPDREMRGRGVGVQLLKYVLQDLRTRGYTSLNVLAKTKESSPDSLMDWLPRPLEFFLEMNFEVIQQNSGFALLRKKF